MIDNYTEMPVLPEKEYARIPTSDYNRPDFSPKTFEMEIVPSKEVVGGRIGELSNFAVDSLGILESFTSTNFIPARIIEISKDFIIVECVVDSETIKMEKRKIEKDLIPAEFQKKSKIFCIKISKRPGKFVTEFIDGSNLNLDKYFTIEDDSIFSFNAGSFVK